VERLLADLAAVEDRLWLVIDDVHELGPETLRQLELLIMRAPPQLRFVLAARHDVRLGLHRLRLEGELAEIRAADLKFTRAEAGQLLAAAGAGLPDPALRLLWERTEGWAAGLRLAALALARHPDPARFAAEFSGTERTVADYLLAEVLERQPAQVRRLLLPRRRPRWPGPARGSASAPPGAPRPRCCGPPRRSAGRRPPSPRSCPAGR
jgi:LuxR family transcriptional regulator, maltose regulon positive regulatory protein